MARAQSAPPIERENSETDHSARSLSRSAKKHDDLDVSVVMPCLNEAETVGDCVRAAISGIDQAGLRGEVLVVDNGSNDGSPLIAERAGARVVHERRRGYGSAYLRGFREARGQYVLMGD